MVARKALFGDHDGPPADASGPDTIPGVLQPGFNRSSGPMLQKAAVPSAYKPTTQAASALGETNPFKKLAAARSAPPSPPGGPSVHPPPLPDAMPFSSLEQLSIQDLDNNPWKKPALEDSQYLAPVLSSDQNAPNVWDTSEGSSQHVSRQASPSGGAHDGRKSELPIQLSPDSEEESAGWDDLGGNREGIDHAITSNAARSDQPPAELAAEEPREGWNLVHELSTTPVRPQLSRQSTWENFTDDEEDPGKANDNKATQANKKGSPGAGAASSPPAYKAASGLLIQIDSPTETQDSQAPPDPAPDAHESPSRTQPQARSMLDVRDDSLAPSQLPRPAVRDKTETYDIKKITWHDPEAARNRVSPILMQNANGPCPLVALVNALTLTTPADINTGLVETLQSREHASLSLLLDAVFEELMSPRRSESSDLPDVSELYTFLKSLHTGMNINPRFIPAPEVVAALHRTSLTHLHPAEREATIPGSFESTREMQLYATFNIPLIHGWLPSPTEAVYGAFNRRAASYEDAQNLLICEEELEEKLNNSASGGLTEDEQHLYHDILEIETFLHVFATQLTPYGLDTIQRAMKPGSFAILFRNDHFSTLYRHPHTLQLLSLVTDAGYANHDGVIWETLVDVNGEHAEFYSGDYRLVSGQQIVMGESSNTTSSVSARSSRGGQTTVQNRQQASRGSHGRMEHSEQEDQDFALALQLQEEEEERHREEAARRSRESRLSEQYIEQQTRQNVPFHGTACPSNATGGGRYSPSHKTIVSPRRSSIAHTSRPTVNIVPSAHGRSLSSVSSLQRQEQTPSIPPRRAQQQIVRPLVPPANPRPAVHRPAEADDGDEAPPSYEQAAKQAPYHPPPGGPGSETAVAGGSGTGQAVGAGALRPPAVMTPASGRPYMSPGMHAQHQMRPQQPPVTGNRGDRDCAIM